MHGYEVVNADVHTAGLPRRPPHSLRGGRLHHWDAAPVDSEHLVVTQEQPAAGGINKQREQQKQGSERVGGLLLLFIKLIPVGVASANRDMSLTTHN